MAVLLFKMGTMGWDSFNDSRFYSRGIETEERQADLLKSGFYPVEDQQSLNNFSQDTSQVELITKRKDCYKVLTCDANDDIVILQGSLMVGVARHAAIVQQQKTEHYKGKPLGILDERECQQLINLIGRLQDSEDKLYKYVKVRVEHEEQEDKRKAADEKQQEEERSRNEVHQSINDDEGDQDLQQAGGKDSAQSK